MAHSGSWEVAAARSWWSVSAVKVREEAPRGGGQAIATGSEGWKAAGSPPGEGDSGRCSPLHGSVREQDYVRRRVERSCVSEFMGKME